MDTLTVNHAPAIKEEDLEEFASPEDLSPPEDDPVTASGHEPEQTPEDPQPQPQPQPQQQTSYSVPQERIGEAATRIAAIDAKRDELAQKYEDGEIDFRAYDAQSRVLADERAGLQMEGVKAAVYADMEAQQRQSSWNAAVTAFYSDPSNAAFSSPSLQAMLGTEIKAIWERPESAGTDYLSVINQARDAVQTQLRAALGIEAQKKEAQQAATKPASETTPIPQTLGAIPAARQNSTGGEFAHLDAMSGFDLENAMQRMSKDQIDRYLSA